jgi:GT2 family glycosyltransferase
MASPQLSIIILSYNTKELIKACLHSVFSQVKGVSFEVIVVDNASSDDSISMIKKEFKKVNLIESKKNLGFGNGINLGEKEAKGEYLLFLNSDAEIQEDVFDRMITFMNTDEKIGILGGKLVNLDGSMQRSYSNFYGIKDIAILLFGREKVEMSLLGNDVQKQVDWVSGGCMFIRKSLFDAIQGFDPKIFMYIEDMEICFRVRQLGYKIYYYPDFVVKHVGYGSSNREFAITNIYKGLVYFYKKHKSASELLEVTTLLKLKAYGVLAIASLTRNSHLSTTYKKALQYIEEV